MANLQQPLDLPHRSGTPIRPSPISQFLLSTPLNIMGTSSVVASDGLRKYTVGEVWPFVAQDIKAHRVCAIDDFLKLFLLRSLQQEHEDTNPDQLLKDVLKSMLTLCSRRRAQVARYCGHASNETARYQPFVEMVNAFLQDLRSISIENEHQKQSYQFRSPAEAVDLLVCRNAESVIKGLQHGGFRTIRKPDLIFTSVAAARFCHGLSPKASEKESRQEALRHATLPPTNDRLFDWMDVLSALEFKLLKKSLNPPPKTYTSIDLQQDIEEVSNIFIKQPGKQDAEKGKVLVEVAADDDLTLVATESGSIGDLSQVTESTERAKSTGSVSIDKPNTRSVTSGEQARIDEGHALRQEREQEARARAQQERYDEVFEEEALKADRPPPLIQTAMYATEALSRTMTATSHVINIIVFDDVLHVWWYDHEGAIQSTGLNFVQDLPRFLALLFAMQRFTLNDWGFIVDLEAIARHIHHAELQRKRLMKESLEDSFELKVGDLTLLVDPRRPVHRQFGLTGRGTRVLSAKAVKGVTRSGEGVERDEEYVVKLYWPDASRVSEVDLLDTALRKAHDNNDTFVRDHTPRIISTCDYDEFGTNHVRRQLEIAPRKRTIFNQDGKGVGEDTVQGWRVLRLIVYERLLPAEAALQKSPDLFLRVFFECQSCHFKSWLYGIHHNDPSLPNFMWRETADGQAVGVLNDWDLAIDIERSRHSGLERTGTVPFMAIDLLRKPLGSVRHLYRHDLEAMLWILTWVFLALRPANAAEVSWYQERGLAPRVQSRGNDLPSVLKQWRTADHMACAEKKASFCYALREAPSAHPDFHEAWVLTRSMLNAMWKINTNRNSDSEAIMLLQPVTKEEEEEDDPVEHARRQWRVIQNAIALKPFWSFLMEFKPEEIVL